ncbi:MAG TPA: hypothetical protein EYP87_04595, partial [Flavobacteriaceae bacterium]|nr:hypothetical protein [Flavobacteriaceae bacterium]
MTLEFIVFILSALFGIFIYWRESKNNYLYRLINKITHSKETQMKKTDKKGFLFEQPLVFRIIYIVILFIVASLVIRFLTPINNIGIIYFTNMIVGTILGTYIATLIVKATDKLEDGQDIIEGTFEKGKEYLKDLTKDDAKDVKEKQEIREKTQDKV